MQEDGLTGPTNREEQIVLCTAFPVRVESSSPPWRKAAISTLQRTGLDKWNKQSRVQCVLKLSSRCNRAIEDSEHVLYIHKFVWEFGIDGGWIDAWLQLKLLKLELKEELHLHKRCFCKRLCIQQSQHSVTVPGVLQTDPIRIFNCSLGHGVIALTGKHRRNVMRSPTWTAPDLVN